MFFYLAVATSTQRRRAGRKILPNVDMVLAVAVAFYLQLVIGRKTTHNRDNVDGPWTWCGSPEAER